MLLTRFLKGIGKGQLHDAYYAVFTTPQGKLVLKDLARHGMIDRNRVVIGDPHQTYFNEGKASMAYHILNMVHMDPVRLMEERQEATDVTL